MGEHPLAAIPSGALQPICLFPIPPTKASTVSRTYAGPDLTSGPVTTAELVADVNTVIRGWVACTKRRTSVNCFINWTTGVPAAFGPTAINVAQRWMETASYPAPSKRMRIGLLNSVNSFITRVAAKTASAVSERPMRKNLTHRHRGFGVTTGRPTLSIDLIDRLPIQTSARL